MIAFFDVDKTVMNGYSGYFTAVELIRRGIIKKRRILKAILYNAIGSLFKQMDVRRMYEIVLADMAGSRAEDMMEIGRTIFINKVKPLLYVEALEEIKNLKSEGCKIVLISSGPAMCIKNMEPYLKADISYCNGPIVIDGILQKTLQEPLCYREGKLVLAEQCIKEEGIGFEDCYFYADGFSDLPLLEKVGNPRVVNPDRNLQKIAEQRKWPILRFQRTLGGE